MDKVITLPIVVSDQNWQVFCDQPSDYVDPQLLHAIAGGQREVFVRRAYEIRRQQAMPKLRDLTWHLFFERFGDRSMRIITHEQQEVVRLWFMRHRLAESCGFPPLRRRVAGRLRRLPTMLR